MSTGEKQGLTDSFNKQAGTYEVRMGTATRPVAQHIVSLLQKAELTSTPVICDNACGTGAVTEAILKAYPEAKIEATDNSDGMITIMKQLIEQHGWQKQVKATRMDSVSLSLQDSTLDANIMNFGIFFTSDEVKAAQEMHRTLKQGGVAVVTCWKDAALFEFFFEVQKLVKPAKAIESLPMIERWGKKETLSGVMRDAGFADVQISECSVVQIRPSMDDLVESVGTNIVGMVGEQWTEQEKAHIPAALREVLQLEHGKYLAANSPNEKGVQWTAWVALARR